MSERTIDPADPVRIRLLEGFADAVSASGYAATTIADIVRHSQVSKRTFYEHFRDKDECFLASYVFETERVFAAVQRAVVPGGGWEEQIDAAIVAYLTALDSRPALARTFLLEIQAAGPRAITFRREVVEQFAGALRAVVGAARVDTPHLREISPAMATAIIGGINELLLLTVERGSRSRLADLAEIASDLVRGIVLAPDKRTSIAQKKSAPTKRKHA